MDGCEADCGTAESDAEYTGDGSEPHVPDGTGVEADPPLTEGTVAAAVAATGTARGANLVVPDPAVPPERLSSVLVAVGGGPHSGATVDVARGIAAAGDSLIELFHVLATPDDAADPAARATGERLLDAAADRLGDFEQVDRWLVDDWPPAEAIVEQSAYYDAVVVGAPTTGTVGRFVFGSTTDTVTENAMCPVVVVEGDGEVPLLDE